MKVDLAEPWRRIWELQSQLYIVAFRTNHLCVKRFGDNQLAVFNFIEKAVLGQVGEHLNSKAQDVIDKMIGKPGTRQLGLNRGDLAEFLTGVSWPSESLETMRDIVGNQLGKFNVDAMEFYGPAEEVGLRTARSFYKNDKMDYATLEYEDVVIELKLKSRFPRDPGHPRNEVEDSQAAALVDFPGALLNCYCRMLATGFIVFHEAASHILLDECAKFKASKRFKEGWMVRLQEHVWRHERVGSAKLKLPEGLAGISTRRCVNIALGRKAWLFPHHSNESWDDDGRIDAYDRADNLLLFGSNSFEHVRLLTLECIRKTRTEKDFDQRLLDTLASFYSTEEAAQRLHGITEKYIEQPAELNGLIESGGNLAVQYVELLGG